VIYEYKQTSIVHDFERLNENISTKTKQFNDAKWNVEQQTNKLNEEIASALYELENEYYSSIKLYSTTASRFQ